MAHRLVVNCRTQRPPSLRPPHDAFRHNLNTFLSSTFKPVFKELQQLNIIPIMRIDFPIKHIIKKASGQLLDAFVDSTFKFVDQPLLPSQEKASTSTAMDLETTSTLTDLRLAFGWPSIDL
ncbi:hypothetical protein LINGRAHAP2_LOCUS24662 [Linum grandiflorum]